VHSEGLSLTVNDDGVGLLPAGSNRGGLGMRTMRFRASSIGAKLTIGTRKGGGVSIACEVAHSPAQAASA
jgi:signal transduction histidine kinase